MNVEVLDATQVAGRAAEQVADWLALRADARIALPAGRTPIPIYAQLVERRAQGLESAHLFQLDEVVGAGPNAPQSFQRFLHEHLLDRLQRDSARDHLLAGDAEDPSVEIARHAQELSSAGGLDGCLLGLGTNGHIAFNEPGSKRDDGARVVQLAPETRAALGGAQLEVALGMTLGMRELLAAREVLVVVTGAGKRAALRSLREGPIGAKFPASFLREHRACTVLADREATG